MFSRIAFPLLFAIVFFTGIKAFSAELATASALSGKWTYRSFHNRPALVGQDGDKALRLIFAEAVLNLAAPSGTEFTGTIDWPGGGLDLKGTLQPNNATGSLMLSMIGIGRAGTSTAG